MKTIIYLFVILVLTGCGGSPDPLDGYTDLKSKNFSQTPKEEKKQVILKQVFKVTPLEKGNLFFVVGEEKTYDFLIRSLQEGVNYSVVFKNLPAGAKMIQKDAETHPNVYTLVFKPDANLLDANSVVQDFSFSVDIELSEDNSLRVKRAFEGVATIKEIYFRVQERVSE